jgi:hypothetical protein
MDRIYPGGIPNRGNTCYLAATLQVLLRFRPFHETLCSLSREHPSLDLISILLEMSNAIDAEVMEICPDRLIGYLNIDPAIQMDICEFLSQLINTVFDISNHSDLARDYYFRYYGNNNPQNLLFRHVPVWSDFSISEILSASTDATTFPDLMFLQLARISFCTETNELKKDARRIIINDHLDFSGRRYLLSAVVEHLGSANSGHYVAYIRTPTGWICCSDSRVTPSDADAMKITSESEDSPAYLVAYTRDLNLIRGVPKRTSHVRFLLFEASTMKISERFEMTLGIRDDIPSVVDEVVSAWETKHGHLSLRFQRNSDALVAGFPPKFDIGEDRLLVWVERRDMRQLDPVRAQASPVAVRYRICEMPFCLPMRFQIAQTVDDLKAYGRILIENVTRGARRSLSFFVEVQGYLVELGSGNDTSVFVFESVLERIEIWIAIDDDSPARALVARFEVVDVARPGAGVELELPVKYDHTREAVVALAQGRLGFGQLALFSVHESGFMEEIKGDDPLFQIVLSYPNLRIERAPRPQSHSFCLVNRQFERVGIPFQFQIEWDDTIERLERRVAEYLRRGSVEVYFREVGGVHYRPIRPFQDMPESRFVALVLPV